MQRECVNVEEKESGWITKQAIELQKREEEENVSVPLGRECSSCANALYIQQNVRTDSPWCGGVATKKNLL